MGYQQLIHSVRIESKKCKRRCASIIRYDVNYITTPPMFCEGSTSSWAAIFKQKRIRSLIYGNSCKLNREMTLSASKVGAFDKKRGFPRWIKGHIPRYSNEQIFSKIEQKNRERNQSYFDCTIEFVLFMRQTLPLTIRNARRAMLL
jgi:hypothetical protein